MPLECDSDDSEEYNQRIQDHCEGGAKSKYRCTSGRSHAGPVGWGARWVRTHLPAHAQGSVMPSERYSAASAIAINKLCAECQH